MTSDRFVPERTVDSMLAMELVRRDPHSLIWSPTNYAGSPDHILFSSDLTGFIFECKAAIARGPKDPWRVPIGAPQLADYCKLSGDVFYVLPMQPADLERPWVRPCSGCGGGCLACVRDARDLSFAVPSVASAPLRLRFQPWFAHWAVVITAKTLQASIGSSTAVSPGSLLSTGGVLLCHFLRDVRFARIQPQPFRGMGLDNFPDLFREADDPELTPPVAWATGTPDAASV